VPDEAKEHWSVQQAELEGSHTAPERNLQAGHECLLSGMGMRGREMGSDERL
jgi:hypothetical protein